MQKLKKLLFQDNTGKYVIGQPPNTPLYLIFIGAIGARVVESGHLHTFFELLAFSAAFTWSYLEIRFGESGVRRVMGVVVMIAIFVLPFVK